MRTLNNKDIIVIGIQPWDISIGSNCKNIALEFSRNNRVLYVNAPLDRISRFRESGSEKIKHRLDVIKGRKAGLERIDDNLWVFTPSVIIESINKIGNKTIFDTLNRINNRRFASEVKRAINQLDFKNYLLFNDQHMFLGQYMKEMLNPELYIYYMRDNLIKNPYWAKQGRRLEPELIKKADCVVTNSNWYTEYGKKYNDRSYMVGQGCDTSIFDEYLNSIAVPDDVKVISSPVIGYVGYLTHRRLDIELLEYLAQERKEWNFVLVGPEDDIFKASKLHDFNNVKFLGSRKPEELPGYVKSFDVAINPQILNDATIGNYPRKIDEYLTLGKPTVATRTPAMEYFSEVVYLADEHSDYIELIEQAFKEESEDRRKKRIETGRGHSWENSVGQIYRAVLENYEQS